VAGVRALTSRNPLLGVVDETERDVLLDFL
jgi:hypothetical protein